MRWITIPTYPVSDGTPQTSTYLTSDDFKPERTKSWEVGADVRLWGNKLILNATYYSSRTPYSYNPAAVWRKATASGR